MKHVVLETTEDVVQYAQIIFQSAGSSVSTLRNVLTAENALGVFEEIKFQPIGLDPLDHERPLNLIEQINQTFTYLVSLKAAEYLFRVHPDEAPFELNLGTRAGSDIQSQNESVAAEVFAAVKPSNNNKLNRDVAKVSSTNARWKYVFFSSPGEFEASCRNGVEVVPIRLRDILDMA